MEITVKNLLEEKARFKGLTQCEYLRVSRVGSKIKLNRKQRKFIFNNIEDLLLQASYNEKKQGNILSINGMTAYNEITKYRDEVIYIDA